MQAVCVAFRRVRFEALQVRRKCAGSTPSTFRARPFLLVLTERGFTYRSAAVHQEKPTLVIRLIYRKFG